MGCGFSNTVAKLEQRNTVSQGDKAMIQRKRNKSKKINLQKNKKKGEEPTKKTFIKRSELVVSVIKTQEFSPEPKTKFEQELVFTMSLQLNQSHSLKFQTNNPINQLKYQKLKDIKGKSSKNNKTRPASDDESGSGLEYTSNRQNLANHQIGIDFPFLISFENRKDLSSSSLIMLGTDMNNLFKTQGHSRDYLTPNFDKIDSNFLKGKFDDSGLSCVEGCEEIKDVVDDRDFTFGVGFDASFIDGVEEGACGDQSRLLKDVGQGAF
jgi:hypothetical protein